MPTIEENGAAQENENTSPTHSTSSKEIILTDLPSGLPLGKYKLVGFDMDTTGRRLVDEIFHIAGYTPDSEFSQYIMPHGDLNIFAKRKYAIRVFTIGRYRLLKDFSTRKILKTKSEITALIDFLDWLEKQKGDYSSIILINHEPGRFVISMLLDSLERYNLLERFTSLVAGFTDAYAVTVKKCQHIVKSLSLKVLGRVLLDKEPSPVVGALDRATITYRIIDHLSQGERQELEGKDNDAGDAAKNFVMMACEFARPIANELELLKKFKDYLDGQRSLRPIFASLLRNSSKRKQASHLRRILVDGGINYEILKDTWEKDKEGLSTFLQSTLTEVKDDQIMEIVEILNTHFDPNLQERPAIKNQKFQNKKRYESTSADGETAEPDANSQSGEPSPKPKTIDTDHHLSAVVKDLDHLNINN